jgi:hypothetical protein
VERFECGIFANGGPIQSHLIRVRQERQALQLDHGLGRQWASAGIARCDATALVSSGWRWWYVGGRALEERFQLLGEFGLMKRWNVLADTKRSRQYFTQRPPPGQSLGLSFGIRRTVHQTLVVLFSAALIVNGLKALIVNSL